MIVTVTAQFLSYHLKKEVDSLNRLADQLQNGQIPPTRVSTVLREVEKQFRQLSQAADMVRL